MTKIIIGVIAALILLVYLGEVKNCEIRGSSFDDVEYLFFGGCMVKNKGKWVPLDNVIIYKEAE